MVLGLGQEPPSQVPPDRLDDLARLGMAPLSPLGEDQRSVDGHLEHAAGGLDQFDVGFGPRPRELGRQTGGPGLIVSNEAVFDRNVHGSRITYGGLAPKLHRPA